MLILKLESILQEILDSHWYISTLHQVLFEQVKMDCQLIYQIVVCHDIAIFFYIYFIMENNAPFLNVIKSIKYR